MAYQPMFGSRHRENLWKRECFNAYEAGRTDGLRPTCNICGNPIDPIRDADWHESHLPYRGAPLQFLKVGVAHKLCNLEHGAKVVTPAKAKTRRIHAKARRRAAGKTSHHPLPGGVRSGVTKTFRHGVQPRLSLAEKHARAMAARAIVPAQQTLLTAGRGCTPATTIEEI